MSSIFNRIFLDQDVLKSECDAVSLNTLETALKNLQEKKAKTSGQISVYSSFR